MAPDAIDVSIQWAAQAATILGILIGLVRMAGRPPSWVTVLLALVAGPAIVLLFMVASGQALTPARLATAVIAGILATGAAVLNKEIASREHRT